VYSGGRVFAVDYDSFCEYPDAPVSQFLNPSKNCEGTRPSKKGFNKTGGMRTSWLSRKTMLLPTECNDREGKSYHMALPLDMMFSLFDTIIDKKTSSGMQDGKFSAAELKRNARVLAGWLLGDGKYFGTKSGKRTKWMNEIAMYLKNEALQNEIIKSVDDDGDGFISREEFPDFLQASRWIAHNKCEKVDGCVMSISDFEDYVDWHSWQEDRLNVGIMSRLYEWSECQKEFLKKLLPASDKDSGTISTKTFLKVYKYWYWSVDFTGDEVYTGTVSSDQLVQTAVYPEDLSSAAVEDWEIEACDDIKLLAKHPPMNIADKKVVPVFIDP